MQRDQGPDRGFVTAYAFPFTQAAVREGMSRLAGLRAGMIGLPLPIQCVC